MNFEPEHLKAFVERSWDLVAAHKARRAADEIRRGGPQRGFEIAAALVAHARVHLGLEPTPEARRLDLEHHVELAEKLVRARHVRLPR